VPAVAQGGGEIMNNGPLLFLGVLVTLASSFWGLILAPQLQFGRQQPRLIEATGEYYPPARPGLAERGADVYRSLGCVECHSQQVRQTGVHFDVWVTELLTNMSVAIPAVTKVKPGLTEADVSKVLSALPARIVSGLTVSDATEMAKHVTAAGAKAEAVLVVEGPDIERKWGRRMTVAQDYLRDYPVQLGQLRLGPDLANYGARATPLPLLLKHLYEPESTMKGSIMPPYRFLFERRVYHAGATLPEDALIWQQPAGENPGVAIVPKDDARALAAYLLSLKVETSLFEAPIGNPPTATAAAAPAAPATNAAAPAPAPAP
jgi:cbb3-type cytochrome oxidase cytochrome c subunit